MLYEDFGGFDGLYTKMLACSIPTAVHVMWIPFSELDFRQQFLLILGLSQQCLNAFWNADTVTYSRKWVLEKFKNINDDIMMTIMFPLLELVIPYPVLMLKPMSLHSVISFVLVVIIFIVKLKLFFFPGKNTVGDGMA